MGKMKDDEVCRLIRERLEHVSLIFDLRHQFNNPALTQRSDDGGWTHPWRYFDALMYYLLITCFDLLGQPAQWVPFSEWLVSSKKIAERQAAVDTIPSGADPVAITKHLNQEYQSIYGVKTSFNNFVLNVLTQEERGALYHSIQISRARRNDDLNPPYEGIGYIEDEKKKLDFLFNLRNKFTHSAVTMGSPAAGILPQVYDPVEMDGKLMKGYIQIHYESKGDELLSYEVRNWPFVLEELVLGALSRREVLLKG